MSVAADAQEKGDIAAGVNVVLGSGDSFTNFGIGAKLQYSITKPLRVEGAFNYFLKKDFTNMWDAGFNLHYLFFVSEKLVVYPLVGAGILGSKIELDFSELGGDNMSASASEFGGNIGGGVDFKLTEKLFLNVEAKYRISEAWSRLLASAGVAFKF
jgi:outer membrane protein X